MRKFITKKKNVRIIGLNIFKFNNDFKLSGIHKGKY